MSYRNIDEDARLLGMARRYWTEEQLTKEQLYWVLEGEGYSKTEINNAISDYYIIHLRSDVLLHHFIAPVVLLVVMGALVFKLWTLIYK
jgi:hypothetical protein